MLDFDLTEEQKALQKMARDFAEKEIRPIAEKLDKSQNLLQDFPWEMIKKADALGLRTIALPKEYDGPEYDLRTWVVLIDELSYPDVSCAKILTQCWKGARRLAQVGTKAQKDRFLPAFRDDPTYLLGGARTEPGSGSDNQLPYEAPNAGVMLSAQRQGDFYVLNGRKHFIHPRRHDQHLGDRTVGDKMFAAVENVKVPLALRTQHHSSVRRLVRKLVVRT